MTKYLNKFKLLIMALVACVATVPSHAQVVAVAEEAVTVGARLLGIEASATTRGLAAETELFATGTAPAFRGAALAGSGIRAGSEWEIPQATFLSKEEADAAAKFLPEYCAGNDQAFLPLRHALNPALERYFRSVRRSADATEDLTQDTWVQIVRARDAGTCPKDIANISGWLRRVSRNLSISNYRSPAERITRSAISLEALDLEAIGEDFGASTAGLAETDSALLRFCMDQVIRTLTGPDRTIALGLLNDVSQAEMARQLAMSPAGMSRRVSTIREALAGCR